LLVSIIIPTYNSIGFLSKAVDSILSQNFKDFEIVIMDNLSVDGTADLIEQYKKKDNRFRLFRERDYGIYDAMNKGIDQAKGDWLYFMGADDTLFDENVLSSIAMHLTAENDIVYGDSLWIPENFKEAGEWKYETFVKANINHQRIFYRKNVFKQYGGLKLKYKIASDHEMNIRFFCNKNIRKKYIPVTICKFHSGGFSANKTDEVFWNDWDEIILKNFKPYLPKKIIYGSLGIYVRYLINKHQYIKAIRVSGKHFYHTGSLGFVKLMVNYFLNVKSSYAS